MTSPRRSARTTSLAESLNRDDHPATRSDLVQRWSRHALDTALREGSIERVLPGVYVGSRHAHRAVSRASALALWAPRAIATGSLALKLYANELRWDGYADLITAPGDTLHPPGWVRVHQRGIPRASSAPQGVRCVMPERALLDTWQYAAANDRQDIVWEALWARVCSWRQLAGELRRHGRVTDRSRLNRMLGWFEVGATSPLEVRARFETFADARFSEFEWQVPLNIPGRRPVADMLHRRARLVVELDGEHYHGSATKVAADRDRDLALAAAGYQTVRLGWTDVSRRPEWCREQVLRVIHARLTLRQ